MTRGLEEIFKIFDIRVPMTRNLDDLYIMKIAITIRPMKDRNK